MLQRQLAAVMQAGTGRQSSMEESTLALAQTLAKQTIHEESPTGSPRAARSHASILAEKVQGFR